MTPLTAPLPLRRTSAWGSYRTDQIIPWRFGLVTGAPVPYDLSGRVFVWADHYCQSIDAVTIDAQPAGGWVWRNGMDSAGRPVAFIELTAPLVIGASINATGRGYVSPTSGSLVDNPGAIMRTITGQILRSAISGERWAAFTTACDAHALVAGGSLGERSGSGLQVLREISECFDAAFAIDAREMAYLRFAPAGEPLAHLDNTYKITSVEANLDALVTSLLLRYDFDDNDGRGAVGVQAPAAIRRHGIREATTDARWITSPRVAAYIATRKLERLARPQYRVSASPMPGALSVGDTVRIAHPAIPVVIDARVSGVLRNLESGTTAPAFDIPTGATPRIVITKNASLSEPDAYASATVTLTPEGHVVTLTQADGSPYAFAAVTLDGQTTLSSDGAGRVTFPSYLMPPGEHLLAIQMPGGQTFAVTVTV